MCRVGTVATLETHRAENEHKRTVASYQRGGKERETARERKNKREGERRGRSIEIEKEREREREREGHTRCNSSDLF